MMLIKVGSLATWVSTSSITIPFQHAQRTASDDAYAAGDLPPIMIPLTELEI